MLKLLNCFGSLVGKGCPARYYSAAVESRLGDDLLFAAGLMTASSSYELCPYLKFSRRLARLLSTAGWA